VSQWPAHLRIDPDRVAALRRAAGARKEHSSAPLLYSRLAAFIAPDPMPQVMGVLPASLRHAGHEWELRKPFEVGRTYEFFEWELISDVTKPSRSGGTSRFAEFARRWVDRDGRPVQTERMTAVHTTRSPHPLPTTDSAAVPRMAEPAGSVPLSIDPSWPVDRSGPPARVTIDHDWDAARPGDLVTEIDAGWVDRAAIATFGGLIGDLTTIHHDVAAARAAGLPDVIAMGTFSAAMTVAVAEDRVDANRIRRCALRFHRPVLPGAPLRIVAVSQPPALTDRTFRVDLLAAGQLALSATLEIRAR
jgi:acyl dehydratase